MAWKPWPGRCRHRWRPPEAWSETDLEQALFTQPHRVAGHERARARPDWPAIHQQLKRKGVTLLLLWQEYKEQHGAAGYQYSQFSHHDRQWRGTLEVTMRQTHPAGEKLFVDYAGQPGEVIDRHKPSARRRCDLGRSDRPEAFVVSALHRRDHRGAQRRSDARSPLMPE